MHRAYCMLNWLKLRALHIYSGGIIATNQPVACAIPAIHISTEALFSVFCYIILVNFPVNKSKFSLTHERLL